jgi:hypothetical protein
MKEKYTEYSKFWLGEEFFSEKLDTDDTYGLLKLSAYRRAIGNFVYILTGKNIPVRFAEKSTSMTDGKVVYIGGELAKGQFDPTVGLALHEASHIVKSDFALIKTIWGKLPKKISEAANGKFTNNELSELCKFVLNVVEDRYIDAWAYYTAPGYRGYYDALYNRYFNLPDIGHGLKSQSYRTPTVKNYKFRFTNLVNKNTDLDALPRLRKIATMLDLHNILRDEMSTPQKRLELSFDIAYEIISSAVNDKQEKKEDNTSEETGSDNNEFSEDDSNNDGDNTNNGNSDDDSVDDILGGTDGSSSQKQESKDEITEDEDSDLSKNKKEKIEKLIKKQEDLINRTNIKSPFDIKTLNKLQSLEKSGVNIVPVGKEEGVPSIDCIVVNNLTRELMESSDFPYKSNFRTTAENPMSARGVREGVVLGAMLGRRLQIRSEIKTTKFTRLEKGKIDRRIISALGYQGENLFYQTHVDKYKNIHLHISVDASSSMQIKWEKTMTTLVAIAKAASMINNVSVSISFRSGVYISKNRNSEVPYVVIAYDSRKDKFSKITQLFPLLYPNGSTPEGLAFQAIMDHIPHSNYEMDSYFVNLSDGQPAFNPGYFGEIAARHTRKQVSKMTGNGVEVISYYLESDQVQSPVNFKLFKTMYGKDAQFIDVKNVVKIAHTLNSKFLSKENS